jgi:aryl-alcohol dehydrogenase-like predicted oxidoreductase
VETRKIGSLAVSVVGVGCNQFGPTCDAARTEAVVHAALDEGVNFFDTADEYGPDGISEEYLGRALRGRRDEAVLASKFGHHMFGDPARGGASAAWIVHAVEDSLQRLRTDRVDLYQQHFPDPLVPAEETMAAMDRLVRDGKVRELGVCNLSRSELIERSDLARSALTPIVSAQYRLNLLRQATVEDILPILEAKQIALIPYFPLASGMLTGKYRRGEAPPPGTRFADHVEPAQAQHMIDRDADLVERYETWAIAHGHTLAELAIAWLVSQPIVASVPVGATTAGQVMANARAAGWRLTGAELDSLASITIAK